MRRSLGNLLPFLGEDPTPECGGGEPFQLSCHHANTTILIGSQNFTVKTIDLPQKTMRLVRTDLLRDVCNPQREDTFINPTLFQYPPYNVTVYYDCPHHQSFPFKFTCGNVFSYFAMEYDWQSNDLRWLRQNCKLPLRVPVNVPMEYFDDRGDQNLTHLLDKRFEFDVKYDVSERCINCLGKDGYCSGYDPHTINSCYYCPDGSNALHCSSKSPLQGKRQLARPGNKGDCGSGVGADAGRVRVKEVRGFSSTACVDVNGTCAASEGENANNNSATVREGMLEENEEGVDQEGIDERQEETGEAPGMATSQKTKVKSLLRAKEASRVRIVSGASS
ncbi:hypothetical protein ACSQ67_009339 [Phaseolus vulgaris]